MKMRLYSLICPSALFEAHFVSHFPQEWSLDWLVHPLSLNPAFLRFLYPSLRYLLLLWLPWHKSYICHNKNIKFSNCIVFNKIYTVKG